MLVSGVIRNPPHFGWPEVPIRSFLHRYPSTRPAAPNLP